MFKNLLLIAFNYPQVLKKDWNARLEHLFVVFLYVYVLERRKIDVGIVPLCHNFKLQMLNCSFSVVLYFLDCLHRGLYLSSYSTAQVCLTTKYFRYVFHSLHLHLKWLSYSDSCTVCSLKTKLLSPSSLKARRKRIDSQIFRGQVSTRRRVKGSFIYRASSWLLDNVKVVFCRPSLGDVMWLKSYSWRCWNVWERNINHSLLEKVLKLMLNFN